MTGQNLIGRSAVVTGGASGIGAACARSLAAKTLADEIDGTAWHVNLLDSDRPEDFRRIQTLIHRGIRTLECHRLLIHD